MRSWTTADWTALSINRPTDLRLPLSGQPIPLYSLNANKFGVATENLLTYSTQNKTAYNGFEVSGNIRRDKLIVFGSLTTDRLITSNCDGSSATDGTWQRFSQSEPEDRGGSE